MADYALEGVIKLRDQTKQATETAAQGVNKLEGVLKTAKAALTAFGVVEAAKAAIELGKLGAQAERTERGFTTISGGADKAAANLDAMMRATNGAIDRTTAMGLANQMMQMGLADSADSLAKNAEMATRLGAAMGVDAITAMENWNAMLANQSLPRLDTYGISSGRVRTRINELMAATADLTREQAFNIAVMEEGQAALDRLGPAIEDNALKIEQSQAAWADLKNEIGMALSDMVAGGDSVLGKFTRQWGDNLRIMRDENAEIGTLRGNIGMLADALGFNNTVFDKYRAAQEAAASATEFGAQMAAGYAVRAEMAGKQTFTLTGEVEDSKAAFDTYTQAIAAAQQSNDEYTWAQREANEAAAAAETAFLNAASALGEMSEAALVRNELDLLKASLDAGTISQEQYRDATDALLTRFGLLTEAERGAQRDLDLLRQAYEDGKIDAEEYATAVENIKSKLDALESREINVKITWDVPPLPLPTQAHVGVSPEQMMRARGGSSLGGLDWVGEMGPELRFNSPGTRIIDHQTSQQIVNNQTINLYGANNAGWVVAQARQAYVR